MSFRNIVIDDILKIFLEIFFNKNLMRQAGFSDEEIESLDERVLAGEVTLDDMSDIAES